MSGWYVIIIILTAGDGQQTERGRVQRCLSEKTYQPAMDANKCICNHNQQHNQLYQVQQIEAAAGKTWWLHLIIMTHHVSRLLP